MTWSNRDLTRLAFSAECRDLSDAARALVPTSSDAHLRPGNLLEDAERLRCNADYVVRLAVAAERARGSSWSDIGEVLGCTRQSAHERFAATIDEIDEGILFPFRDGQAGALGWSACPSGVEDPERTIAGLDAWVARHRERTDTDRGDHAVSANLGKRDETIDAIGRVTTLATRLAGGTLPTGVSERTAQRMLLEAKVHAYHLIAGKETGEREREARRISAEAWDELVEWHRTHVRERLGHVPRVDGAFVITLDGRPVQLLAHNDGERDADLGGWWLWNVAAGATVQDPGVTGEGGDEVVAAADAPPTRALAGALDMVCDYVASDLAKGTGPFDAESIAGDR